MKTYCLDLNTKQMQKVNEKRTLNPNTRFIASKESFKELLIDWTKSMISGNYRDFLQTLWFCWISKEIIKAIIVSRWGKSYNDFHILSQLNWDKVVLPTFSNSPQNKKELSLTGKELTELVFKIKFPWMKNWMESISISTFDSCLRASSLTTKNYKGFKRNSKYSAGSLNNFLKGRLYTSLYYAEKFTEILQLQGNDPNL